MLDFLKKLFRRGPRNTGALVRPPEATDFVADQAVHRLIHTGVGGGGNDISVLAAQKRLDEHRPSFLYVNLLSLLA